MKKLCCLERRFRIRIPKIYLFFKLKICENKNLQNPLFFSTKITCQRNKLAVGLIYSNYAQVYLHKKAPGL
jgi:hypothetical protein